MVGLCSDALTRPLSGIAGDARYNDLREERAGTAIGPSAPASTFSFSPEGRRPSLVAPEMDTTIAISEPTAKTTATPTAVIATIPVSHLEQVHRPDAACCRCVRPRS